MAGASLSLPGRRDPVVRRVVSSWRHLTGGTGVRDEARRTLVACSGGADSSALLIALATVSPAPVVAHIVHDMRPPCEAGGDRDAVRDLCARLGIEFLEGEALVADRGGNDEANAREVRYAELERLAGSAGLNWIATGHHADDQVETVIMRLLRGAGAKGLAGIRPTRHLGNGLVVVRPMLTVLREEAHGLCMRCGWEWVEDLTNKDTDRLRAAVREGVIPSLREIEPEAARRVARSIESVGATHGVVEEIARDLIRQGTETTEGVRFDRGVLRSQHDAVLAELLFQVHERLMAGRGRDRLTQRVLRTVIGVLLAESGELKVVDAGGMRVTVSGCFALFS